jgi:hypothetical protein
MKRLLSATLSVFIIFAFPASVLADAADTPAPDTSSNTQPSTENTDTTTSAVQPESQPAPPVNPCADKFKSISGTKAPTGSSAGTFKLNDKTCLYENEYYTWSPFTKEYTPLYPTDVVLNSSCGCYQTTVWDYSPVKNKYVARVVTVGSAQPAADVQNGNGTDSTDTTTTNNQTKIALDAATDAKVKNAIVQYAFSGDTKALQNTTVGNVLSGSAADTVNIINLLQSTWDLQGTGNLVIFSTDINGDVTGDLYIDPAKVNNNSLSLNSSNNSTDITVNSAQNSSIDNDVNLVAGSGDVDASKNTTVGNVQSGNAAAIAHIVNMINSAIGAGKSFIGVININGNLNGDILLPPDFLQQLIASGAPSTTLNIGSSKQTNITANANSTAVINNQTNLNAASGDVEANKNTKTGNISSGDATTKLTVFNLTGQQLIGANSIMVFVNVFGQWVGLIVDAPAGSTAAGYCGGNCTYSNNSSLDADLNSSSTNTINNDINLTAQSGDVSANKNTTVGNVQSGNASAQADIVNFINSKLSLTDWFGLLFINVFGTWNGSFGVDTDAGTIRHQMSQNSSGVNHLLDDKVFQFVPNTDGGYSLAGAAGGPTVSGASTTDGQQPSAAFIGSSDNQQPPAVRHASSSPLIPIVGAATFLAIVFAGSLSEYGTKMRDALLARQLNAKSGAQRKSRLRFTSLF